MENNRENQERSGDTIITSVSVTKFFDKLIKNNHISPTEAFRRGVAVSLCDLGVGMYQSQKNEDRMAYVKEFMAKIEADEQLQEQFEKFEKFDLISKHLKSILKIAEDIAGEKQWKTHNF